MGSSLRTDAHQEQHAALEVWRQVNCDLLVSISLIYYLFDYYIILLSISRYALHGDQLIIKVSRNDDTGHYVCISWRHNDVMETGDTSIGKSSI